MKKRAADGALPEARVVIIDENRWDTWRRLDDAGRRTFLAHGGDALVVLMTAAELSDALAKDVPLLE